MTFYIIMKFNIMVGRWSEIYVMSYVLCRKSMNEIPYVVKKVDNINRLE